MDKIKAFFKQVDKLPLARRSVRLAGLRSNADWWNYYTNIGYFFVIK